MAKFNIPCSWEMYGIATVEADTLEEAISILENDETGLPLVTNYVEGSFKVEDIEIIKELN